MSTPVINPIVGGFRNTATLLGVQLTGKVPALGVNGVNYVVQRAVGPVNDFVGGFNGQGYLIDLTLAGATNDIDADAAYGSVIPLGIDAQNDLDNTLPRAFTLTGDGDVNVLTGSVNFANDIFGGGGNDVLTGGNLADYIDGGSGNDAINGGAGDDQINGGSGNDTISGGAGNDQIAGGNGADTIAGGDGNDVIDGGNGQDTISGGNGNDHIAGGSGNDSLFGDGGDDVIDGGDGNDAVNGGAGNDLLAGGNGNDAILGGGGDDTLVGGGGNDAMQGGGGRDTFVFEAVGDTTAMPGDLIATGDDRIDNFQVLSDNLDFAGLDDVEIILINNLADNRTVFQFFDEQGTLNVVADDRLVGSLDVRGSGVGGFFNNFATVNQNIDFASGTTLFIDGAQFMIA